jgi:phage regulator Rha-like protein
MKRNALVPTVAIQQRIFFIRGQKVMLDVHLAEVYRVATKNLNKAVRRNKDRFPGDFMLQLTKEEFNSLRFHFGTSNAGKGGRRYLPYAFTEQGIAMLSSVLHGRRAAQVNIEIMRAFVKLRELLATHKDLARKLEELERKYDAQFRVVFDAIRRIIQPPDKPKRRIGFHVE